MDLIEVVGTIIMMVVQNIKNNKKIFVNNIHLNIFDIKKIKGFINNHFLFTKISII
jgi:hypothetical protein